MGFESFTPLAEPFLLLRKLIFYLSAIARLMHCDVAAVTHDDVVIFIVIVTKANITDHVFIIFVIFNHPYALKNQPLRIGRFDPKFDLNVFNSSFLWNDYLVTVIRIIPCNSLFVASFAYLAIFDVKVFHLNVHAILRLILGQKLSESLLLGC